MSNLSLVDGPQQRDASGLNWHFALPTEVPRLDLWHVAGHGRWLLSCTLREGEREDSLLSPCTVIGIIVDLSLAID